MLPIQPLRKKDPVIRAALARRPGDIDWEGFDENEAWRKTAQVDLEDALSLRRKISDAVALAKHSGNEEEASSLLAQASAVAAKIPSMEAAAQKYAVIQNAQVSRFPNVPHADVPDGHTEQDNRVVRSVGSPSVPVDAPDHVTVSKLFGGIDAHKGAMLSGSRFSVMEGSVARLHRALIQMMLDMHIDNGHREMYVPYLVKAQALFGTGQLPKFEEDLFKTQDDLYLIPTAEVPLTNLVADQILTLDQLPLAWCAHTPCFRREAGSAGKDVHGLIRQHQFEKVEMVRIEHPNNSEQALQDHVVMGACGVLDALELPYRVVELCAGDLGFSSSHTFDLEVWLPSQNTYREISSCSNMGDFQTRRMNTRLRDGGKVITPHSLNGSGLAVGRSLVAVLENHIQPDHSLYIPDRLRSYLGNKSSLDPETKRQSPTIKHS